MTGRCGDPPGSSSESSQRRMTYRYILEACSRLGRVPTLLEMEQELQLSRDLIARLLKALEAEGAVRCDPTTLQLADAYPYSAIPTRHGVVFRDGRHVYCMSAIAAFCVSFLTKSDLTIHSRCSYCQAQIRIGVARSKVPKAEPTTAIIWESAASYDWPKTNFFCSEAHLLEWRGGSAPGESGRVCCLDTALDRGHEAASRIRQSAGL